MRNTQSRNDRCLNAGREGWRKTPEELAGDVTGAKMLRSNVEDALVSATIDSGEERLRPCHDRNR